MSLPHLNMKDYTAMLKLYQQLTYQVKAKNKVPPCNNQTKKI
ncbi:uncharacterized protein MP3633_3709 [Marinomonas primoryensis]|uniref:Uncharacterized protein n=1 Tax=Marinomonas primoryensis TaxID=178399 RepID=A0A859D0E6_9GAMM|nr:uncharacterized protein MP3633_3709 [Marinomonas primoryensis]